MFSTSRGRRAALVASLAVLGSIPAVRAQDAARRGPTLGDVAKQLAATPGAFDAILARLGGGNASTLPLSDAQREQLRQLVTSGDFSVLDREPRLTIAQLGAVVDAAGVKLRLAAPVASATVGAEPATQVVEALGIPTHGAPPADQEGQPAGFGVTTNSTRFDADLRGHFPDSKRLASVLERLAENDPAHPSYVIRHGGSRITSTEGLIHALRSAGHEVTVLDRRRLANFADVEKDGTSVAAPLWLDTGRRLANGKTLALPAPHSELVIVVRGPEVNAEVTFFNGLDTTGKGGGGVHFRPWASRGAEWWTGGKLVNEYKGDEVETAVRIMGQFRHAAAEKIRANQLPLDGYFKLGVCATAPALVEKALRGRTTAWPLTQDPSLFQDDTEIDRLVRSLPVDGRGAPTPDSRLLRAAPWADRSAIPFPEVKAGLDEIAARGRPAAPEAEGMEKAVQRLGR